jgi:DNA-binding beta-propeller fold protein YncE
VGELPGQKKVGRQDSYLRKYDPDGKELWTRQFAIGTYSEGRAIAASAAEVYVAGATRDDAFVRKFDGNGKELWTRQFGTASDADDQILGIALDPTGIYVAGSTADVLPAQTSAGNADAFVRKYDPEGKELWTRQFGTSSFDQARGIAVNASGVYVSGLTVGTMPGATSAGSHDVFVRKYDADGKELWTRQFGTSNLDEVCAIGVDESGVYIAGTTRGVLPGQTSLGGADMFVRKYDTGGNEMWTRQLGTAEYDQARAMSVHDAGVYVTGWTLGSIPRQASHGMHDVLIVRFSTAGEPIWTHQFGSSNLDDPFGISVDASGIYVAGLTGGKLPDQRNAGNVDTFVAKLENGPAAPDTAGRAQGR